jgi:hypothetical protein
MALVVCLMRKNVTPEFAGAIFGIRVLADFVPQPDGVVGAERCWWTAQSVLLGAGG